jgi:hypothetical protein
VREIDNQRIIIEIRLSQKLPVTVESDVQTADKFIRFRIKSNCVTRTVDPLVIIENSHSEISTIFIIKKNGKGKLKTKICSRQSPSLPDISSLVCLLQIFFMVVLISCRRSLIFSPLKNPAAEHGFLSPAERSSFA